MKFELDSLDAMNDLARRIAKEVRGGDTLELVGDIGAGKTTFTKALAAELGVTVPVQSPTFTISSLYDLPGGEQLAHYDFYRLHDPGVMRDELAEVAGNDRVITVLEWADIVAEVLPADRLTVHIDYLSDESARGIRLQPHGERARRIIESVTA